MLGLELVGIAGTRLEYSLADFGYTQFQEFRVGSQKISEFSRIFKTKMLHEAKEFKTVAISVRFWILSNIWRSWFYFGNGIMTQTMTSFYHFKSGGHGLILEPWPKPWPRSPLSNLEVMVWFWNHDPNHDLVLPFQIWRSWFDFGTMTQTKTQTMTSFSPFKSGGHGLILEP